MKNTQEGLNILKKSVLELLKNSPKGKTNTEIAKELNLLSDFQGRQKNYLTYSLLGLLLSENKIITEKEGKKRLFYLNKTY